MSELDEMLERLENMRRPTAGDWYRVDAKAGSPKAEVWIYDEIRPWAVNAQDLVNELRAIKADDITVHLNTPGGDAFGGIAIYNALRDHPATVTVVVDAMAASAGSLVAQAGDVIRMNRGAQMMIHEASGLAMGRASEMETVATMLNKVSDSMAGIYASRAGGTIAEWRDAMRAESWYSAAEAVEAGLAHEMVDEPAEPDAPAARASWDLSVFAYAYAGRDKSPAPILNHRPDPPPQPRTPPAPAVSGASSSPPTPAEAARRIHAAATRTEPTKEGAGMDPAKIREALGLQSAASDDEVKAALASAGLGTQPPEPAPEPTPEPAPKPELVHASGTMSIDVSAWQEQQERIKRLEAADTKRRREERDQVIANAVQEGKFAPSRKEHWVRLWDADPEGTRQVIDGLAKNVISVEPLGYAGGDDGGIDDEFASLFPQPYARKGA